MATDVLARPRTRVGRARARVRDGWAGRPRLELGGPTRWAERMGTVSTVLRERSVAGWLGNELVLLDQMIEERQSALSSPLPIWMRLSFWR